MGDPAARRRPPGRGRLWLALAALVLVGAVVAASGARSTTSDDVTDGLSAGSAAGRFARPVATNPTTSEPSLELVTEPPTSLPTEPVPDDLPADWYAPTPLIALGTIEIPKLGLRSTYYEGITLTVIDNGPGHWPGTPLPGGMGNMVIPGHRVTHSRPFNRLDELVPGDQVVFTTSAGRFVYEVRGTVIARPEAIGIAAQNRAHTATLFACHPKGSAAERIAVKLRLLGPDGQPVDPDEALPPIGVGTNPATDNTLVVRKLPGNASSGRTALPDEVAPSTTVPEVRLEP